MPAIVRAFVVRYAPPPLAGTPPETSRPHVLSNLSSALAPRMKPPSLHADQLAQLVIDLVPQWYVLPDGTGSQTVEIGGHEYRFASSRALTPQLKQFRNAVEVEATRWLEWLDAGQPPSALRLVQEAFALEWLRAVNKNVNWSKLLAYTQALAGRTYENQGVVCNLVISPGLGGADVTDSELQKIVDPLASSMQSFLRVDHELRLLGYEEIPWNAIEDAAEYKLYPEFLHPFRSVLGEDDISVHQTSRGDLLVMKGARLQAARRKGNWRIYDPSTLKNCIGSAIGDYWVGANCFEFLLDLSFRRHGALLVFDPGHTVLPKIVNRASVVAPGSGSPDAMRQALGAAVGDVKMGQNNGLTAKKRLMIELASLDGAIVFDEINILAIGAMIGTHPDIGSYAGARTTAARSAQAYGGRPIKVSADGDIDVLFIRQLETGESVPLSLSFL